MIIYYSRKDAACLLLAGPPRCRMHAGWDENGRRKPYVYGTDTGDGDAVRRA